MTLKFQRLLWLEQRTAAAGGVLTEAHLRLLRQHRGRVTDPEQHIEALFHLVGVGGRCSNAVS